MPHQLKFRVLDERLAVCQVPASSSARVETPGNGFFCSVRTADELSVVCSEEYCRTLPEGTRSEAGWVALKLEGPFPFSMTGVLASFLQPLAQAGVPIFAISTFDTDYVLIKQDTLPTALAALSAAGHSKIAG